MITDTRPPRQKMRKMFSNTTSSGARATTLRVIGALIVMAMLIWSICYGYQALGPQRHPLDQWISWVGALIMISGFLLLALGIPIIADLFFRLLEELQYRKENDIYHSSKLEKKVSVWSFIVWITLMEAVDFTSLLAETNLHSLL